MGRWNGLCAFHCGREKFVLISIFSRYRSLVAGEKSNFQFIVSRL